MKPQRSDALTQLRGCQGAVTPAGEHTNTSGAEALAFKVKAAAADGHERGRCESGKMLFQFCYVVIFSCYTLILYSRFILLRVFIILLSVSGVSQTLFERCV